MHSQRLVAHMTRRPTDPFRVPFWDALSDLQKLGIPTAIVSSYRTYYDTPLEDMSNGDSIQIMPGVNKNQYGEAWNEFVNGKRTVVSTGAQQRPLSLALTDGPICLRDHWRSY